MFCFGWFRYTDMSFSTQSWRQSFQTSVMFHENYYMSLPPRRSSQSIFWHFVVYKIWSMFSLMWGTVFVTMIWTSLHTLLGTHISPIKSVLKMIFSYFFIFPKRDMLRLVPWRVAGSVCGIVTSRFWYHLLDPEVWPSTLQRCKEQQQITERLWLSASRGALVTWLARGFPGRTLGRDVLKQLAQIIARHQLQAGILIVVSCGSDMNILYIYCIYIYCIYVYFYTSIYSYRLWFYRCIYLYCCLLQPPHAESRMI